MFYKSLKKVVSLVNKNKVPVLVGLLVVLGVVVYMNMKPKTAPSVNKVDKVNNVDIVDSLQDVVGNVKEENKIKNELNNVLKNVVKNKKPNNVSVNVSEKKNVQENFNIADCLAAGGDYESCK